MPDKNELNEGEMKKASGGGGLNISGQQTNSMEENTGESSGRIEDPHGGFGVGGSHTAERGDGTRLNEGVKP